MEIIKRCEPPKPPTHYQGECSHCHSIIKYELDEIIDGNMSHSKTQPRISKQFCPVCNDRKIMCMAIYDGDEE